MKGDVLLIGQRQILRGLTVEVAKEVAAVGLGRQVAAATAR